MPSVFSPALSAPMASPSLFSARKVRVVCIDPDATDSSSGEEDSSLSPKRLVREVFIPPTFSFSLSNSHHEPRFLDASSKSIQKSWSRKRLSDSRKSSAKCKLHDGTKKSRSRLQALLLPRPKGCVSTMSRGKGIRQRSCGKWAAGNCKTATEPPINGRRNSSSSSSSSCCNSAPIPEEGTHETLSLLQASGSSECMGDELFRFCSDMESVEQCPLMTSPSSASQSAVCDSSALPAPSDEAPPDALSDVGSTVSVSFLDTTSILVDHCNSSLVNVSEAALVLPLSIAAHSSQPTMASGARPNDPTILSPQLLDELPFFDFGQMLDFEGSGNCVTGGDIPHMSDPFDDLLTGGGELDDGMSFDFDSEALAWINVPEVCAV